MPPCRGNLCSAESTCSRPCATCLDQSRCACKRLAALDVRIKDTKKKLVSLERQRVPLKSELNQAHDTLLSRLPEEVIYLIFLLCTPTMVDACHTTLYNVMRPEPLKLGAVCRRWRTIAWSTPRLWASISVNVLREDLLRIAPLADDWLERARSLPLTINVYVPLRSRHCRFPISTELLPMLDALARHSRRWRHVSLELLHRHMLHICDNPLIERPTALDSIHIHRTDVSPPESSPVLHLAANHNPQVVALCKLELKYLNIGWEDLTYLRVSEGLPLTTAFKLLECAPKLQYYELWAYDDDDDSNTVGSLGQRSVVHHELRCLNFQGAASVELAEAFLGGVSLPALEELDCDIHHRPISSESITSLISTASRGLRRMSLGMDHARDNRAISILEAVPSLTQLTLKMYRTSWQCFDALGNFFEKLSSSKNITKASASGTPFLPNLQDLCIDGPWPINWSLIADIFPPAIAVSSDDDGTIYRPLRAFAFLVDSPNSLFDALSSSNGPSIVDFKALEVDDIRQFLKLRDRGIALKIVQRASHLGDEYDLISYLISQRSVDFGLSPPSD